MLFFFSRRRRDARFKCEWSSDVCSSDLVGGVWACTGTIKAKRQRSREMRKIVRCGMSWFSFLKFLSQALVPGCGADYTEGSFLIACFPLDAPRLVLWSVFRMDQAIRDACDLHHFYYVVNTHKV